MLFWWNLPLIMYPHKSVNKKPLRARSLVFCGNVYEFVESIKNHHICHALPFVASLVKLYTNSMKKYTKEVQNYWYANFRRSIKLEPNCCLQETYWGYATLWGLSFPAKHGA